MKTNAEIQINKKGENLSRAQESLILQLIRRGDRVAQVAHMVGVRPAVVENVLDQYISEERLGW